MVQREIQNENSYRVNQGSMESLLKKIAKSENSKNSANIEVVEKKVFPNAENVETAYKNKSEVESASLQEVVGDDQKVKEVLNEIKFFDMRLGEKQEKSVEKLVRKIITHKVSENKANNKVREIVKSFGPYMASPASNAKNRAFELNKRNNV